MSIESRLREIAARIANSNANRILALEKEMAQLDARKAEIQAKLDSASLANDRLVEYEPRVGNDYMCPECRLNSGVPARLKPIPGADRTDRFRCERCNVVSDFPA